MAEPIADKMREGVDQGVFPGGVLLVSHRGRTVHHAAYGAACLLPEPEPATVDTIYDLASLTKPLVTTTAVALLLTDGRLSLEDPLERFVPELTQVDLRQATIRHLLNHTSGLPAWRPLYERIVPDGHRLRDQPLAARRAAVFEAIHCEPLVGPVGRPCLYSGPGLLRCGASLRRFLRGGPANSSDDRGLIPTAVGRWGGTPPPRVPATHPHPPASTFRRRRSGTSAMRGLRSGSIRTAS